MGPVPVGGAGVDRRPGRPARVHGRRARRGAGRRVHRRAGRAGPDAAIGLAIFPRVACTVGAWESFAERVRRTHADNPFLAAAFHPDYRAPGETLDATLDAARLVPFIRRTPDPTLQLVRASLVDRLRGEVSADVGRANFANVTARGLDKLDALLADIRRDRDASYARLC